ncbi:MAG: flagellar M-ring protein FliF [Planctomycetaceae bacterium]|nr:flagellar M-ring protein FliF [Planctomycetaceae bacterium]
MEVFETLKQQLMTLWQRWTMAQRVGISAAAAACVAAVVGTFIWATRADYVVLANSLTPQRAAEIAGVLDTEQIEYELNFSGSAISVARSDVSRARLALKDVWEPSSTEDAAMGGMFPGSPSEEEDRRRRALEGRIARSVTQIRGIRTATVHISKPDPSPFVDEQTPTTASVIVEPSSAGSLTVSVAESIISLVARAVEGLDPEKITLMDTAGRQFNIAEGNASSMDGQFEYQQRVELRLASKAESMLALLLGHGKAVVRVTADIDFRETTRTEQSYDPDSKVKRTETVETVAQSGGVIPAGEAGVASNVLLNASSSGSENGTYKREVISSDYENTSVNEVTRDIPGRIQRLTVAAIVDLSPPPTADTAAEQNNAAAATPVAAGPIDPAQIESIIRQAVGYDETRGDEIQVMNAALQPEDPLDTVPAVVTFWQKYEPLIQSVLTAFVAAIAFLLGFLLLKRMTPVVVRESVTEAQMSIEEVQHLAELSRRAKDHPEIAAKILAAWLGGDSDEEESSEANTNQAPPATRRSAA